MLIKPEKERTPMTEHPYRTALIVAHGSPLDRKSTAPLAVQRPFGRGPRNHYSASVDELAPGRRQQGVLIRIKLMGKIDQDFLGSLLTLSTGERWISNYRFRAGGGFRFCAVRNQVAKLARRPAFDANRTRRS